ncbi:MAG: NAD(P)-dependent dehydrogenase (short-subunit alcohol dehydrogenase family) [Alphaproteobacteria bacterium]|jgi:NAD(P)-dependent dehydrogenase (short-subunit alcohol dehydrogenase family)
MNDTTDASRLDGRVALVSGGARGVGLAIARTLAAQGAKIVIADAGGTISGEDPDPAVAAAVAAELGDCAAAFSQSIADAGAAQAAVALAHEAFGGLDILVNNAAILRDGFIFKSDPADFDAVLKTNLAGAWYLTNAATPLMRQHAKDNRGGEPYQWGRVVNITSTAGLYGNFGQSSYASAKSGMLGLMRTTAMDLTRAGITCNAVAPFAATRVTDTIVPANDEQAVYKERALKVSPDHVAMVVAWLCSPEGQAINGQLFGVRGREVFLFSQPRPIATLARDDADWDVTTLSAAAAETFAPLYTDLRTDLEVFNTDPKV